VDAQDLLWMQLYWQASINGLGFFIQNRYNTREMCEKLHSRASYIVETGNIPADSASLDGNPTMILRRSAVLRLLCFGLGLTASRRALSATTCHFCSEEIQGRYMVYKSSSKRLVVCSDCDKKYPKCEACKLPHVHKDILLQRGERLCRPCAAEAKYCTICQKRIQGRYYTFAEPTKEGEANKPNAEQFYCASCYSRAPKCKVCNRPTPRSRIDLASGACIDCLPKLHHCDSCGVAITGRYFEIEHAEGRFCEKCKRTKPACYTCGVPVGSTYWKFDDGRAICNTCHERAVTDEETIRKIWREVTEHLQRRLGMNVTHPLTLNIKPLNANSFASARRAKEGLNQASPLSGSELGLYRYKAGKADVFLLYGIPIEMIYETAAHEYAHAWQTENCPPKQSIELKEGFAQWVAAQLLKDKGFSMSLEKLEDRRDRPYGTGYNRFKKVEESMGKKFVFEYAKKQLK